MAATTGLDATARGVPRRAPALVGAVWGLLIMNTLGYTRSV